MFGPWGSGTPPQTPPYPGFTPIDSGWQKVPEGEKRRRKIRPIALTETLLKMAETCAIEEAIGDAVKRMEPEQFGCGTPDGAIQMIGLARNWARAAEQQARQRMAEDLLARSSCWRAN